jgi:hypothetical protein
MFSFSYVSILRQHIYISGIIGFGHIQRINDKRYAPAFQFIAGFYRSWRVKRVAVEERLVGLAEILSIHVYAAGKQLTLPTGYAAVGNANLTACVSPYDYFF